MPQFSERQRAEKMKDLAVQEKMNVERNERGARREQAEMGLVKEEIARKIFSGGINFKQDLGMKRTTFVGSGSKENADRVKRSSIEPWISLCCKKQAFNYYSLSIPGKPVERRFKCRHCYRECEAIPRPPRKKSSRTKVPITKKEKGIR